MEAALRKNYEFCFVDHASLYNLVNKSNLVHNFFFSIFIFVNLYMFRATMCPSSGETTVFMWHLLLVILYGRLTRRVEWIHSNLHTGQSSTQNNKYEVAHKHSCFSWWWAHNRPKHVEIYKYTKNKLGTKLASFTVSNNYKFGSRLHVKCWLC